VLGRSFNTPDASLGQKERYDQKEHKPQSREAGGGECFLFSRIHFSGYLKQLKKKNASVDYERSEGFCNRAGWVAEWTCFNCWIETWV
jgi:hypothetical protein